MELWEDGDMNRTSDDITRDILHTIRSLNESAKNEKIVLNEEKSSSNAVAITDDPRFGNNALSNQIAQFRSAVDSGAQFSTPKKGKVAESPLIYMPDTGNLVFSGVIPRLNNLKWQFVLKTNTGNGCFVWSDGMIINKENMQTLNKLYGFYKNWCDEWWSSASDLEKIANNANR